MKTSREIETIIQSYLDADDACSEAGIEDLPDFYARESADFRRDLYLRPVRGPEDVIAKIRVLLGPIGIEGGACPNREDICALELIKAWVVVMLGDKPESVPPRGDSALMRHIVDRIKAQTP